MRESLHQLDERADQERKRADEERLRAEEEQRNRKEADKRAELERQRVEEAQSRAHIEESKTRRTTFEEYIRTCHTLLSKPLRVQTDKSLSTQGSITSPKDRRCPTLLKPWSDFPIRQQHLFEQVHEYIRDAEQFSSVQYLTELGQDLCDRPLASEKDLEAYQRLAIAQKAS